jgi:uncharacterized protein YifN (PemK superfamily)
MVGEDMGYKKFEILTYTYPETKVTDLEESKIIKDYHRVVVLHSRETPYRSILVAPITKASKLAARHKIPANYVPLKQEDYPGILDEDSYINLDMIRAVDSDELDRLERYGKTFHKSLEDFDQWNLDYKITLTYELGKYLKREFDTQLEEEFANVITYIDENIKTRVTELLSKIDDKSTADSIISIIDELIESLRQQFIQKK